jgi:hypothetical protein
MAELTEVAEEKLTDPIAEEEEEENTEISNDDCESIHSESIHSESDDDVSDLEEGDNEDDVEINKQTCALFLQQLWDAQRVNIKKKKTRAIFTVNQKISKC